MEMPSATTASAVQAAWRGPDEPWGEGAGGVFAVFQQDRRDARVAFQDAGEFGSAIAAISDDSSEGGHWLFIHCYV
jgi:hypothetical protein